jgi:hypothetical protein
MTAATFLLLALPALQTTSPLTTGTRVRVTVREAAGQRVHVGPLRTFDSSVLSLSTEEGGAHYVSLARSSITRIEVSRGTHSRWKTGALLGGVLGLAAIALVDAGCSQDCSSPKGGEIAAAVGGGLLVGAGVGALMRNERWESLPWAVGPARSARILVAPAVGSRAAAFRLTLRF